MSTFTLTGDLIGDILGGIADALAPGDDLETHMMCHNAMVENELEYQSDQLWYAGMEYDRRKAEKETRRGGR